MCLYGNKPSVLFCSVLAIDQHVVCFFIYFAIITTLTSPVHQLCLNCRILFYITVFRRCLLFIDPDRRSLFHTECRLNVIDAMDIFLIDGLVTDFSSPQKYPSVNNTNARPVSHEHMMSGIVYEPVVSRNQPV